MSTSMKFLPQIDWTVLTAKRAIPTVPATTRAETHSRPPHPLPRFGFLRSSGVRFASPASQGFAHQERYQHSAELGTELCVSIRRLW